MACNQGVRQKKPWALFSENVRRLKSRPNKLHIWGHWRMRHTLSLLQLVHPTFPNDAGWAASGKSQRSKSELLTHLSCKTQTIIFRSVDQEQLTFNDSTLVFYCDISCSNNCQFFFLEMSVTFRELIRIPNTKIVNSLNSMTGRLLFCIDGRMILATQVN